jgi:hypothetical protein
MSHDEDEDGPVIPPKDPRMKKENRTAYLAVWLWEELDAIAKASGEYSRNELMQLWLENRIAAWRKEQAREPKEQNKKLKK